jgi:hypothetical protein
MVALWAGRTDAWLDEELVEQTGVNLADEMAAC